MTPQLANRIRAAKREEASLKLTLDEVKFWDGVFLKYSGTQYVTGASHIADCAVRARRKRWNRASDQGMRL